MAVFGVAPDPIEIYRGPTGRRALNHYSSTASITAEPCKLGLVNPPKSSIDSGSEGKSLRNVSRGDWRSLEPIAQMYVAAILEGGPDILMAQELVRCTALPISPPTWCDPTVADLNGSYSLV